MALLDGNVKSENKPTDIDKEENAPIFFSEFLERTPPGTVTSINILGCIIERPGNRPGAKNIFLKAPDIELYCKNCKKKLFFRSTTQIAVGTEGKINKDEYLVYKCSNCNTENKVYSINIFSKDGQFTSAIKYGEIPEFGPHTPSKLTSLVGAERDIFFKGRRCESQGLGIGAFSYYRRVVEHQKNKFFDEIIKVSKIVNPSSKIISELETAKKETQFSKAIGSIKTALPECLLINGQNPLTLLHTALSDGLHDRTDEYCLELATDIRIVLAEFSERLSTALKDDRELKDAVNRLAKVKNDQQK